MNYDECVDWCEFKWIINRPFAGHLDRTQCTVCIHTHIILWTHLFFEWEALKHLCFQHWLQLFSVSARYALSVQHTNKRHLNPADSVCQKVIKNRNNLDKALTDNDSSKMTMRRNLSPNASVYLHVRCKEPYTIRTHGTWVRNSKCKKTRVFFRFNVVFHWKRNETPVPSMHASHIRVARYERETYEKKRSEIHACSSRHVKLKCMSITLRDDIAVVGEGYIGWFIRL